MFSIEMLPANHGDCLWIEYGTADRPLKCAETSSTAVESAMRPRGNSHE